jgi:hypothetical protein
MLEIGSHAFAQAGLDLDPIYASCIAGMAGAHHHTQLSID